jgi:mono/diheme cytochrome c family protein
MRYFFFFIAIVICVIACERQTYKSGERLYKTHCANCHMDNGAGLSALIPPLAGADYLADHQDELPCLIRNGLKDTIIVNGKMYAEIMPANEGLSDIQITNILNYVNSSWGNQYPAFQLEALREMLKKCQ